VPPLPSTGHTGHVAGRFDWVKLGQRHGVGGDPIESKQRLGSACLTAGCPDMRQNPVGEPAATAALNFGAPRRRSAAGLR
jgi:hypothetical protein